MPHRADNSLRPFGWAGLLMELPESFRLIRTDGAAHRGSLVLADDDRTRLHVSWAAVSRRRFNAERFVRRQLARAAGKRRRDALDKFISIEHESFRPLLMDTDDGAGIDRCVGYCPATSRVVKWVYHRAQGGEKDRFRGSEGILASTRDQPLNQPARWAFFDVSFIAPAGFVYRSAALNLGDMRVSLGVRPSELSGPGVAIRHVYPATLAFTRQPLEAWHRDWLRVFRKTHRTGGIGVGGLLGRGEAGFAEESTLRGPMLVTNARARFGPRLQHWRMAPCARLCTLHDQAADRIVTLYAAARPERVGPLIDELLAGLHWAADNDGIIRS